MVGSIRSRYGVCMNRVLIWLGGAMALGVAMLGALAVVGYRNATAMPRVRTARLALADWPAGAKPIRVALLSDIHIGNVTMDAARLTAIMDQVNASHPDLVLLAGDFVVGHEPDSSDLHAPRLTAPLSRLHPPLGTYAVLGNHDHWTGAAAVTRALAAAGVVTLSNRSVRRGPVTVVGTDDAFSGHADTDAALRSAITLGGAKIVLNHSPDIVRLLRTGQAALVLAGHTHCGQIVWPNGKALASRAPLSGAYLFDPRYRCGIVRDPGRTVIVTAGLGSGTAPLRLNAPPDWWLLTLGPPQRGS